MSLNNYQRIFDTIPMTQTTISTVVPVLIGVLFIQLPVSYLGALGIGGLRPLGRRSEWLLLLFSPWLFVTIFPLSIAVFQNLRSWGLLNTLTGLVTPILVNIPILFVLTLFFKGKTQQWRKEEQTVGSFFLRVILPSLPLALLLAGIAVALGTQDVFWPLLAATSNEIRPLTVTALSFSSQFISDAPSVAAMAALLAIPTFVLSFIVFAVFQVFYLDRLALGMGDAEEMPVAEVSKPAMEEVKAPPFQIK